MHRPGLLLFSVGLLACGADTPAKRVATPIAEAPTQAKHHIALTEPIRSIAIHRAASVTESELIVSTGSTLRRFGANGDLVSEIASPLPDPRLVGALDAQAWVVGASAAKRFDASPDAADADIALAPTTSISAIELGFDGTVFLADAQAQRIYANTEVLAEGDMLGQPGALLLNGGSLLVGNQSAVLSYDLKSGDVKPLANDLGPIVGLALDHLGYVVVGSATGEIRQLATDGTAKLLHTVDGGLVSIALDETSRVLYAASGSHVEKFDYLALTGEDSALWARRDARPMHPFSRHGMTLSGAEYWPSHGMTNVSYPDDILWGFYPSPDEIIEGSTSPVAPPEAATRCAEQSFAALEKFFESNPESFHKAAEATGASKRFYLWINDYSQADAKFPHEIRMNKFWYWERKPAVTGRVPGFWKWETTLLQDGTCLWPQAAQIEAELAGKLTPAN